MKLRLVSGQNKGLMGGVSFEVKGRVELTPEEQELIRHYKLEGSVVLKKKAKNIWGQVTDTEVSVLVKNLLSGDSFKCKSLDEVISYRESLISACRNLKSYLDVARTFDKEEIIDIDAMLASGENDNAE
jgi:hypothetical protein